MKTTYGLPYFEQIHDKPGLNRLKHNTCGIIDLSLLVLAPGETHVFSSGDREFGLNVMSGTINVQVDAESFDRVGTRQNPFEGKPAMVYAGRDSEITLTAITPCEVALASSLADEKLPAHIVAGDAVISGAWGEGNTLRHFNFLLGPEGKSSRLWLAEVCVQDGRWATYPPHKHEDVPGEIFQEEMYFYKTSPAHGFGFCALFEGVVGEDYAFLIRNNTVHKMPFGNHTVTAAPGYQVLYLAIYAGHGRSHKPTLHPAHADFQNNTLPFPASK